MHIFILVLSLFFQEPEKAKATHENYKQAISNYQEYSDKVFTKEFAQAIKIVDKKTEKTFDFTTLKKVEQRLFILVFAQEISQQSYKLQQKWIEEIKKFDKDGYSSDNPKIAKKDDVIKYSNELLEVRKKFAVSFEDYVIKFLDDFKDDVTQDEKVMILKRIKDFKK
jgi:hypothetical protein